MKKEKEKELVNKYPNLFRDYCGDMRTTCLAWGFECGGGWYDLIDSIGKRLIELNLEDKVIAVQVKEKFGGLRFYYNGVHLSDIEFDKVRSIIDKAEEESYSTCEVCGDKGEVRGDGWLKTLCGDCNEKRNK